MIILITALLLILWTMFEMWRAPLYDERTNTHGPTKKLSDLFKKKK
jgi:hypothetical protein